MTDMFVMCAAKFIIPSKHLILTLSVGVVISTTAFSFEGSSLIPSGISVVITGKKIDKDSNSHSISMCTNNKISHDSPISNYKSLHNHYNNVRILK